VKRYKQSLRELLSALSTIESNWRDAHADQVILMLKGIPARTGCSVEDVRRLLDIDFATAMTVIQLFLDMSKDEFAVALRAQMGGRGIGVTEYRTDPAAFVACLEKQGLLDKMRQAMTRPLVWHDVLVERLKAGRGSAIKGQLRGRMLENFVEGIVKGAFAKYDLRCRFVGATGESTEKADFAIPSKEEPRILIEAKAYGATGSKQTDILGDIGRIVQQKRHDTDLLLVTDGITWHSRANDLRKLVAMQNKGMIARIYTKSMADDLASDLRQLRKDHALA
jgi:hypothetical protein